MFHGGIGEERREAIKNLTFPVLSSIEPMNGQSICLLWQKLWHREPKQKPPKQETPTQKKQRLSSARKAARNRPFEHKESYRWVEALTTVENLVSKHTQVVHVFDREGDITEVFDKVRKARALL